MWKWILAAVGIFVLSIAVSVTTDRVLKGWSHEPLDAAAAEDTYQVYTQYEPVPLVRLLATPERYDGRKVLVGGFVTLDFEGSGLYLDQAAYDAGLRMNALWIDAPSYWRQPTKARGLNHRYGEVAGTFVGGRHGHLGQYAGTVTQVRRIWPTYTMSDWQSDRTVESRKALVQDVTRGWFVTLMGWIGLAMFWALRRYWRSLG